MFLRPQTWSRLKPLLLKHFLITGSRNSKEINHHSLETTPCLSSGSGASTAASAAASAASLSAPAASSAMAEPAVRQHVGGGLYQSLEVFLSGQVRPRQGTEICNFWAPPPLEALHWIFCSFSSIYVAI